jgi:hypothetical protein
MTADAHDKQRQRLVEHGMTNQEIDLWYDLGTVAGRFLDLPILHPNERDETVVELHKLQNRLLSRPGLRAVGWPRVQG